MSTKYPGKGKKFYQLVMCWQGASESCFEWFEWHPSCVFSGAYWKNWICEYVPEIDWRQVSYAAKELRPFPHSGK
jgi:hypothetical protein